MSPGPLIGGRLRSTSESLGMSDTSMSKTLEIIANDITYIPNDQQRKLKSAFWTRFNENPICEPQDVTVAIIQRVAQDGRLEKWWSQAGFKEWFRNQEEFRERVESMAHLALDTLMVILVTDDPKMSSARVNAAKLLLEMARKLPSRTESKEKYADEKISGMSKKQLDAYIARHMQLLPAPTLSPLSPDELDLDNDDTV